jgi:hypothetical protein
MAVSTDGGRLFVVDDATSVVVPVDLETRTAGTAWPLASYVPASGTRRDRLAYANVWGSGVVLATDGRAYDAATGAPYVLPYFSGAVLAASRNGARFCGISMGSSPYELDCYPLDRNGTTGALLIGAGSSPPFSDTSGYGYDVGLFEDGSRVYTAAAYPYLAVFDVSASGAVTKAGDFGSATGYWPIALDVVSDGRVACGANNYNTTHAWVYDAAGTLDFDTAVTGLLARGIATSGDGLRLAAITSTALDLFTIGP